jgi:hypothetical protein
MEFFKFLQLLAITYLLCIAAHAFVFAPVEVAMPIIAFNFIASMFLAWIAQICD